MDQWREVAPGVHHRRYQPVDVSVTAIVGSTGVVVVDTRNNPAEAAAIEADVLAAFGLPVVAAIDTHAHYDHSFGNQWFARAGIPVYGHHRIPAHFARFEAPRLGRVQAQPGLEADKEWAEVVLTAPSVLVDRPTIVRPGGREVHLLPIERGHTDTDLAVFVPDVRVWALGDVIEQSGPPMFGSGSFPLSWPDALGRLLNGIDPGDVIIPGHGAVVDRAFVVEQAAALAEVAAFVRSSHAAGVPAEAVDAAAGRAAHPALALWPDAFLRSALADGYAELAEEEEAAAAEEESSAP
ncbi:MBL fold metallo-hydrolase [Herbiconiux sp. 11R-BC]|uniref:MBL fold metallo-hydrolase n=1 Tax=Herbiconiux sp. 11R-BC TaxID=3111637 RepID=UPI003C076FDD